MEGEIGDKQILTNKFLFFFFFFPPQGKLNSIEFISYFRSSVISLSYCRKGVRNGATRGNLNVSEVNPFIRSPVWRGWDEGLVGWKQRRVDNDGIRSWSSLGCKTLEFHPFRARTGVAFLHVSSSETTFLPIRRSRCHTFLTLFIDGEQKRISNQIPRSSLGVFVFSRNCFPFLLEIARIEFVHFFLIFSDVSLFLSSRCVSNSWNTSFYRH